MSITGLIFGTVVLWVLTYVVSVPLARVFSSEVKPKTNLLPSGDSKQNQEEELVNKEKNEAQSDVIDNVPTGAFILVHVLVLGLAGYLLGALAGVFFIGFASKAKMWPGIVALVIASLVGAFSAA